MSYLREKLAVGQRRGGIFVAATLLACVVAAPLCAQDSSLALVPKDAYFYQAGLRHKEQWQLLVKSKAWAKLNALPVVKMAWQKFDEQWGDQFGPLAGLRQWVEQDENRQLVDLLIQMASDECFVFGGRDSVEFSQLLSEVQMVNQFAPLVLLAKNGVQGAQDTQGQIRLILQTVARKPERLKAPDVVVGFKLANGKVAQKQLERLENLIQNVPPLAQMVKKNKIGGGQYLTLELDGGIVPWEQLPIRNFEENAGEFDALMKRLKNLKVSINLGLRGQFLLVGVGESTAQLANLGKGPTLADHPDLKPLAKFADRRLCNISYVSKESHALSTPSKKDVEAGLQWALDMLKDAGLTAQQQAKLRKDLTALAGELYRDPELGSSLSFSFLTERGVEGYDYERTKDSSIDASKNLTLLNHVGGAPLFFTCMRSKYDPNEYDTLVKVLKLAHQYFEELGLPHIPPEGQQHYAQAMKIARPLLVRLHQTTGKKLVPALADGQSACVLDAKLTSKQWHKDMPVADKPLAIPEFALVLGVSDPVLLRQAMVEYRGIFNDAITEIRKFVPPGGPEINISAPEVVKSAKGTLYFYPIPEMAGLDKRLVPTAGLGDKVAVLTLSKEHASRLLSPTPLPAGTGPLAKTKGPVASVTHLDWAGLIAAGTPWVDFGMREGNAPDDVRTQVHTGLQFLQCLRSFTSVTYLEGGAIVSHSETIFRDVD